MKKFSLILISFCLLFTGCNGYNKSSAVTVVTTELSFIAKLNYMNNSFDYSVTINENGDTAMKYISNSGEIGTDYIFQKDTVTYCYNSLEYKTDISSIPSSSVADFIYIVFREIDGLKNNVCYKNQQYYIKSETDKYKFKIILGQTGLPIKITDSQKEISVEIKKPTLL